MGLHISESPYSEILTFSWFHICDNFLCVTLTGLSVAQIKHHFWVFLGGCFLMKLALESVNSVNEAALLQVDSIIQLAEGLNKTKR